ncbi:MAG: COG4705 family protein [Desulfurivibrionaceae bacterium]
MLNRVPEVAIFFWIIKIMATTLGETGADFLIFNLKFGMTTTSYLMGIILFIALSVQIRTKEYIPLVYWITVVLISIVGTLITDNLVDNFGVRLETTVILFSIALSATFLAWYVSQKTLSIHTIYTTKRELFYWTAILFTFALGTAAGDLAAERWNLGYAVSGLIFATLIGIITLSYYLFKANAVVAFWFAYILTRPLGASLGDYLSQPAANGGLNLGTINTSIAFFLIIFGLVFYLSISRKNLPKISVQENRCSLMRYTDRHH